MNRQDVQRRADDVLEAALKEFGQAEPRAGLEGRILAHMRAQQQHPGRSWNWGFVAATAAVLTIAALVAIMRMNSPAPIANKVVPPAARAIENAQVEVQAPSATASDALRRKRVAPKPLEAASAEPRLDQFPSPQPLSEQEQMLAGYIMSRGQEAKAMARAQTELHQQDQQEFEMLAERRTNLSGGSQ